jgi:hypothetical protein
MHGPASDGSHALVGVRGVVLRHDLEVGLVAVSIVAKPVRLRAGCVAVSLLGMVGVCGRAAVRQSKQSRSRGRASATGRN